MHRIIIAALITLLAVPAFAADDLKTEEQKTLYTVGQVISRQLAVFNLTPAEFEIVLQGLTDAMGGKPPRVEAEAYSRQVQELAIARRKAEGDKLTTMNKEFLEKAATEKGAVKTASGLVYVPLKEGSGANPTAADKVKVNYRGTLVNGKEFDNSFRRGQAVEFPLTGVIKCWTEGVQMMKPGGKARLVCPADIAYGKNGTGMIPANATLNFEVELLDVIKQPAPAPAAK